MFSSKHEIYKFSVAGGESDDWLPYAEDLVNAWSNQESGEVKFKTTFDIILASLLLMDDLLPPAARKAFAELTLDTISEAQSKKLRMECLKIEPPPPGRKKDRRAFFHRFHETKQLIDNGTEKNEAYKIVARKHHKSPSTIRRDYERAMKKIRNRNQRGN